MDIPHFIYSDAFRNNLISTALLLTALLILRSIAIKAISHSRTIPREHKLQWIVKARSFAFLVLILGLLIIWASELQAFAVSLVAVAAAFVLAFKEVIANMSGYFARASAQPFSIGDRIEINGFRGDVVDQNLFFTKILEIGPGHLTNQYTGRSVSVPNSAFLNSCIINESFTDDYTLHVFKVPVRRDMDLCLLQSQLLECSERICAEFIEPAEKAFESFGRKQGLETPSVQPRVHLHYSDKDTAELIVRIPAPISRKGRIEQEILKEMADKLVYKLTSINLQNDEDEE